MGGPERFFYLNEAKIKRLVPIEECLHWSEQGLAEFSKRQVTSPPRLRLLLPEGRTSFMPCYLPSRDCFTCKVASFYGKNKERGYPSVVSSLLLIDPHTGYLKCLMDATYITALRTGAMAGVAAKYLPYRKKGTVGVIGAGAVARWGFTYLNSVMSIERVLVYSRSPESRKAFARQAKKIAKAHVTVLDRPDPVASSADVLLCATSSKDPVFDGKVLREGSLVISLGANTPDTREIDSTTILRSKIIVDSIESALKECGEFILPIREGLLSSDRVAVEIGQIISGEVKELSGHEEIVLMKSVGLAAVDAVVASYVYERAVQQMQGKS